MTSADATIRQANFGKLSMRGSSTRAIHAKSTPSITYMNRIGPMTAIWRAESNWPNGSIIVSRAVIATAHSSP